VLLLLLLLPLLLFTAAAGVQGQAFTGQPPFWSAFWLKRSGEPFW
jgi:hypothetical protein